MAPKVKVKPKVAAKAKASAGKDTNKLGLSNAQQEDVNRFVKDMFQLCDVDSNGCIQYGEFLHMHHVILNISAGFMDGSGAGFQARGMLDADETEITFRKVDADNNLSLSQLEFRHYMDGLFSILGFKNFTSVCEATSARKGEFQAKGKGVREGCDLGRSSTLLEKLSNATFISEAHPSYTQVVELLDLRADPDFTDAQGCNALFFAAAKGDGCTVATLMEFRADPKLNNRSSDCPVFRAAVAQNFPALRVLLGVKASEERRPSQTQRNSLRSSQAEQRQSTKKWEIEEEHPHTLSEKLCLNMNELSGADVAELIRKKADVRHKSERGWTPLTMAAFFCKKECMETLLRIIQQQRHPKPAVNGRNLRGRSALHVAGRKADASALIPLLVHTQGDPDLPDYDGWTPLHHAAFNGNDANVLALLAAGASLHVRGRSGFTPLLATTMPMRSGELGKEAKKALEPSESVQFKEIALIINRDDLSPYDRLQAISKLPGVCGQLSNLRLYEQYFPSVASGPNKVRLHKVWDRVAAPMIRRLRTQECDMEEPGPQFEQSVRAEMLDEIQSRRREQKAFVEAWFIDTMGPRPHEGWKHDNRACFAEEMDTLLQEELGHFQEELNKLYEATLKKDGGTELAALAQEEVLNPRFLSQLGAHNIPVWLEEMDAVETFKALRRVGVANMDKVGADEEDNAMSFMELLANDIDLEPGPRFWKNIYKTWLHHYAHWASSEFHSAVIRHVKQFNEVHDGQPVTYRQGPLKSIKQMKRKERSLGTPSHETFAGRTVAANILDVVRGSVTAACPRTAVRFVEFLKNFSDKFSDKRNPFQIVRVKSNFGKDAETELGYRRIEINVFWDGGPRETAAGWSQLAIVGEIQIVLADYLAVKKRRHLLYKYRRGDFEWPPEDDGFVHSRPDSLDED